MQLTLSTIVAKILALVMIASPQTSGKWNMVGIAGQNATKHHVLCPASRVYNKLIIC